MLNPTTNSLLLLDLFLCCRLDFSQVANKYCKHYFEPKFNNRMSHQQSSNQQQQQQQQQNDSYSSSNSNEDYDEDERRRRLYKNRSRNLRSSNLPLKTQIKRGVAHCSTSIASHSSLQQHQPQPLAENRITLLVDETRFPIDPALFTAHPNTML